MGTARQILAIGGVSEDAPLASFLAHALGLCAGGRPRLGFLATASGDRRDSIERFHDIARPLPCEPSHLPLFERTPDPAAWLAAQDLVLVSGGNTKSMLAVWREWGIDSLLRQRADEGLVLAGWSAGAICWFEQGVTDSWTDALHPIAGLGLLPGSCCPHLDSEGERRPEYHRLVATGELADGIGIEDGAAVHWVGDEVRCVVAFRRGAQAYRVERRGDGAVETPLAAPRVEASGAA